MNKQLRVEGIFLHSILILFRHAIARNFGLHLYGIWWNDPCYGGIELVYSYAVNGHSSLYLGVTEFQELLKREDLTTELVETQRVSRAPQNTSS